MSHRRRRLPQSVLNPARWPSSRPGRAACAAPVRPVPEDGPCLEEIRLRVVKRIAELQPLAAELEQLERVRAALDAGLRPDA